MSGATANEAQVRPPEPPWLAEPRPRILSRGNPTSWRSFDVRRDEPGPWHARHDRPGGRKVVTWHTASGEPGIGDHHLEDLVYLAGDVAEILAADHSARNLGVVVVAEGEKAADAIAAAGFAGVGTVCGAGSTPGPAVVELLARKAIVLAPDNDDVGRRHMDRLGRLLEAAGVPSLAIVRPPAGSPPGWDLADCPPELVVALVLEAVGRPIWGAA